MTAAGCSSSWRREASQALRRYFAEVGKPAVI